MTKLFARSAILTSLNAGALTDPRMTVINADGFRWAREARGEYDAIVLDFPDPVDFSLGKLYTETFYREVKRLPAPGGVALVQSTLPLVAHTADWTLAATLRAAAPTIGPYHAHRPSSGPRGHPPPPP